jgi:hypothetical protein
MDMEQIAIKTGGLLSILLGIGHCYFYRVFNWENEFQKISTVNAKALYTIHIFLIPLFFLFGYLSWVHTSELAGESTLGITLTVFYSLFWLIRASWQIIYFTPNKSDNSNRLMHLHYFLTAYFFVLCATYSIPIYMLLLG